MLFVQLGEDEKKKFQIRSNHVLKDELLTRRGCFFFEEGHLEGQTCKTANDKVSEN